MSAFPSILPKPQGTNYGGNPEQSFIRTEMESGTQRQRQRFTAAPHMLTMIWVFTAAQMATFKSFFDTDIHRGTDWFTMDADVGAGIANYNVRFTAPYEYSRLPGAYWQVTAKVEVRGA